MVFFMLFVAPMTSSHYKSNSGVSAIIVLTDSIFKSVKKDFIWYHLCILYLQNGVFGTFYALMVSSWRHLTINRTQV